MSVIDTHQHLWDIERFRLPWLDEEPQLARTFSMDDYLAATDGLDIRRTIYMEVDVDPSQQVDEAELAISMCRRDDNPMVAAVISGRPADEPGFRAYISRYRDSPYIKGVRQVLHRPETPPGYSLQEPFVRSVRLLGEWGMHFEICLRANDLEDAVKLATACPETRLVLDHCGNPDLTGDLDPWRQAIGRVAARPNVICKVSGFIVTARAGSWSVDDLAPVVNHVFDAFGPDRLVFGSDWPVCTLRASYRQWFEALRSIVSERPAEEQRKLFHDNAVEWYRLAD